MSTAEMDEQGVQALLSLMKKSYKTAKGQTASEIAEKKLLKKRYLAGKRFVDLGAERRGKLGKELVMQLIGEALPRIDDPDKQAIAFTTMAGSATEVTLPGFLKWWDVEKIQEKANKNEADIRQLKLDVSIITGIAGEMVQDGGQKKSKRRKNKSKRRKNKSKRKKNKSKRRRRSKRSKRSKRR